jgi:hypothetical protein
VEEASEKKPSAKRDKAAESFWASEKNEREKEKGENTSEMEF